MQQTSSKDTSNIEKSISESHKFKHQLSFGTMLADMATNVVHMRPVFIENCDMLPILSDSWNSPGPSSDSLLDSSQSPPSSVSVLSPVNGNSIHMYDADAMDSSIDSMRMTDRLNPTNNDTPTWWNDLVDNEDWTGMMHPRHESAQQAAMKNQFQNGGRTMLSIIEDSMNSARSPIVNRQPMPRRSKTKISSPRNRTRPIQLADHSFENDASTAGFKLPVGGSILTDWWDDAISTPGALAKGTAHAVAQNEALDHFDFDSYIHEMDASWCLPHRTLSQSIGDSPSLSHSIAFQQYAAPHLAVPSCPGIMSPGTVQRRQTRDMSHRRSDSISITHDVEKPSHLARHPTAASLSPSEGGSFIHTGILQSPESELLGKSIPWLSAVPPPSPGYSSAVRGSVYYQSTPLSDSLDQFNSERQRLPLPILSYKLPEKNVNQEQCFEDSEGMVEESSHTQNNTSPSNDSFEESVPQFTTRSNRRPPAFGARNFNARRSMDGSVGYDGTQDHAPFDPSSLDNQAPTQCSRKSQSPRLYEEPTCMATSLLMKPCASSPQEPAQANDRRTYGRTKKRFRRSGTYSIAATAAKHPDQVPPHGETDSNDRIPTAHPHSPQHRNKEMHMDAGDISDSAPPKPTTPEQSPVWASESLYKKRFRKGKLRGRPVKLIEEAEDRILSGLSRMTID